MKRGWWIVLVVAGGCAGPQLDPSGATTGAVPRDLATGDHVPKTPPAGSGGGATASGCNGVTEKGRCEISDKGQVAVVCDVGAGKLQRFDCSAMQKVCVIDSTRGATCATLPPPVTPGGSDGGVHTPPPPADMAHALPTDMASTPPTDMAHVTPAADMASTPLPDLATAPAMCASGVDYRGYCASATASGASDTAIWCDTSTGQTLVVSCAALGKTCQIDACADGAYCCDAPAGVDMPTPPSTNAECDTLGFAGACESGHARWCSGGQTFDIDCGARGQQCAVDQCAQGAYCCDAPPATTSECDRLGIAGECANGVARWCSGGQIIERDCGAQGQTCEVDTCATGAYCCSH
ncbi:MAG TPA: hypothetical protein VF997_10510 [Polyangia bacterium]